MSLSRNIRHITHFLSTFHIFFFGENLIYKFELVWGYTTWIMLRTEIGPLEIVGKKFE